MFQNDSASEKAAEETQSEVDSDVESVKTGVPGWYTVTANLAQHQCIGLVLFSCSCIRVSLIFKVK